MNFVDYYTNRIKTLKMKYEANVYSARQTMYQLGYIDRDIYQRIREHKLEYKESVKITRMLDNLYMEIIKNENQIL